MPLFFLGTREWRNRQTRTVQVRVPVMEWGFNSPLAHDETADPFGICGFCFPWLLLVDPRVFRAPEGPAAREARASLRSAPRLEARPCPPVPPAPSTPVGPGCAVGGGPPASRPRCEPSARRVASNPGQAPPPPTGTAADPSGALHTGGAVSLECGWVRRLEARPGPVPRSVPYPQFRMQFPDTCSSSLSEKPGISTIIFQSMKCARGNCMRVFGVAGTLIPAGRAAGTREPGWPVV